MRRGAAATVLTAAALGLVAAPFARADPAATVDPFVGTGASAPDIRHGGGAGATLPGAATPFGLVQLSPETLPARAAFGAGYAWADDRVRGFSPTHVSGTGCAVLGDVPVLPLARGAGGARRPSGARRPAGAASPAAYRRRRLAGHGPGRCCASRRARRSRCGSASRSWTRRGRGPTSRPRRRRVGTVGPACRAADDAALDPARDGAASVAMERATADFAVAELAGALGRDDLAAPLRMRSAAWRALGVLDAPPASTAGLVEGSAAQYAWAVPFDVAGLAGAMGGRDAAFARLDALLARLDGGPATAVADLGNQPSLLAPWLYAALGRPAATQRTVRRALLSLYTATLAGLPGNDDAGALSAWWVLGALGLYPAIPGTDVLLLGSPLFPRAELRRGKSTISIDAPGAEAGRPYVRAAMLGSRELTEPRLRAADLRRVGPLRFAVQADPAPWGVRG
jgi:putative alpha-1,2-mannosidase